MQEVELNNIKDKIEAEYFNFKKNMGIIDNYYNLVFWHPFFKYDSESDSDYKGQDIFMRSYRDEIKNVMNSLFEVTLKDWLSLVNEENKELIGNKIYEIYLITHGYGCNEQN